MQPTALHLVAHLDDGIGRASAGIDLTHDPHAGWLWARLRALWPDALVAVLLPNHLHLLLPAVGRDPCIEQRRLRALCGAFARRLGVAGELWRSIPPAEMVLGHTKIRRQVRYIALNPCRPPWRLVNDPLRWRWTTHRDVCGAVADPWVSAVRLASALGQRRAGFTERHHRYVSSDPSVSVSGTPLPEPPPARASNDPPDASLGWIASAALEATRSEPGDLQRQSPARSAFVQLAHHQGWRSPSQLAQFCGIDRTAAWRLARHQDPHLLAAASLCLADQRLRDPHPLRSASSQYATKCCVQP